MTDEQRTKLHSIKIKQAMRYLEEIKNRQKYLINGNFTAVAKKYGVKVKELRTNIQL